MPEDVGGTPPYDGQDPDDSHHHGDADEEFATVVFDEDFVRSAPVHEPSAVERLLAAAEARAEADPHSRGPAGFGADEDAQLPYPGAELGPDAELYEDGEYGPPLRWHRPVAWMLALVMGVGMVALAFTAVYRGASSTGRPEPGRPTSSEVEGGAPPVPGADASELSGAPDNP